MSLTQLDAYRRYEEYQFLYPPRPEKVTDRLLLPMFEAQGFVLQFKKNGTNNVLAHHQGKIVARQRDRSEHVKWAPSPHTAVPFAHLPGWTVMVAELLHSKVKGMRDINYINDILVADSKHLTGTTFAERQAMLAQMFDIDRLPISVSGSHYIIDDHTWLARNHTTNFGKIFAGLLAAEDEGIVLKKPIGLSAAEDEGIVLKQPTAVLKPCLTAISNVDWQFKLRVPKTSYDR